MTLEQQKQIEREFQDAKTPDEIAANCAIDKERFNLPDA